MAHCGRSNYSRPDFAERASPLFWKRVLNYTDARGTLYKALRLNLGHIGGTREYAENKPGAGWMEIVVDMLGDPHYPNLYADFAYDSHRNRIRPDSSGGDSRDQYFGQPGPQHWARSVRRRVGDKPALVVHHRPAHRRGNCRAAVQNGAV